MKRILSIALSVILLLSLPAMGSLASAVQTAASPFVIKNGVLVEYTGNEKSVTIPSNVTSIGKYAFSECYDVSAVTIPNSVKSIGEGAFSDSFVEKVSIGNGVTNIGEDAFYECSSLKSVTFGNSITSIGASAFYRCNMTTLPMLNSVKSIGEYAFSDSGLKTVNIGSGVTSIGKGAFSDCRLISNFTVNASNPSFVSVGGVLFNKAKTRLIQYPAKKSASSYTVPATVTEIGFASFTNSWNLEKITLGNAVTSIGDRAFHDCEFLTTINIPNSVKSIGYGAFNATAIQTITIGRNVTDIGEKIFGWLSSSYPTLRCGKDSAAHKYAKAEGIKFTLLPIDLSKTAVTLGVGATHKLTAYTAKSGKVTWTSSNKAVATVSSGGTITAKGVGTAKMTAKTADNKTAVCTVTVKKAPSSVKLNKTSLTLGKGESSTLTASIPAGSSTVRSWSSSNTKVATVSSTGKITAKAGGTTTITVKTHNGKTAKCTVTVKAAPTSVKLSSTKLTLNKGKTATLKATLAPSGAASLVKSWTSSNTKIAKVDANGKVTAIAKGTATITFKTFNGKTAKCVVTVK